MENTKQNGCNQLDDGVVATETQKQRNFREENISKFFAKLNDRDQQAIYRLVWSLSAGDLLLKLAKDEEEKGVC